MGSSILSSLIAAPSLYVPEVFRNQTDISSLNMLSDLQVACYLLLTIFRSHRLSFHYDASLSLILTEELSADLGWLGSIRRDLAAER
jgi:hypothetical protein